MPWSASDTLTAVGVRSAIAFLLVAAPSIVAGCGSSQGASGMAADGGPGSAPAGDNSGVAAACDDFFGALAGCSLVPSALAAHASGRFRQYCENQASLPGSMTTVAALEACARAFRADCTTSCRLPNVGTLPGGAPCNAGFDLQCQSGSCGPEFPSDGGPSACSTCANAIPLGQPCSVTGSDSRCAPGSQCAGASNTCVPYGDAGAACSSSLVCATDFFCSPSQVCVAKAIVGAACTSDMECADAHSCVAGVCAPRAAAGAPCTPSGFASPCALGLTCDSASLKCVAPSVQPGGACGAGLLCVIGTCSHAGVCPTVVPDGQPCPADDTHVCDVEAFCDSARTCSIPGSPVCR